MNIFCETCHEEKPFLNKDIKDEVSIRGTIVKFDNKILACKDCGYELNDPYFDGMRAAYDVYEKLTGEKI